MNRALSRLAIWLSLPLVALPQNLLPPEVVLLSKVKRHVKEELARLPDISCLETVQREIQPPAAKPHALDTVRLEVLATSSRELYAAPGERKFSENHPISYVGSGVIGDGFFGMFLREILVDGSVSYDYKGEEDVAGRRLARYDYRLPLMASGHNFHLQEGSGRVGVHGSFWADPQTFDVLRLEMNAEDFPPTLPLIDALTVINYAPTSLGGSQSALLPQSGEFYMTRFSGEVDHNHIEFTHCRLYGAQSSISFVPPDAASEETPRFGASSNDDTLRPLPPGLQIAVRLNSKISEGTPVGTLIEGTVADNVTVKGKVIVANGSRVRGRIRRLERYSAPSPHFILAIEFTELEFENIRYRFYADPMEIDPAPGVEQTLNNPTQLHTTTLSNGVAQIRYRMESITLPGLPGVAAVFIRGTKLDLPPAFRTVWKTRALTP
jgi:hypothetical protein